MGEKFKVGTVIRKGELSRGINAVEGKLALIQGEGKEGDYRSANKTRVTSSLNQVRARGEKVGEKGQYEGAMGRKEGKGHTRRILNTDTSSQQRKEERKPVSEGEK